MGFEQNGHLFVIHNLTLYSTLEKSNLQTDVSEQYVSLIQAEICSYINRTYYHMVFFAQPLYCSGTFGETEIKCMERSETVKSRTDPALELKLILNPPTITSKNTIFLLASDISSLKRFLSHQIQKVLKPLVYLGGVCVCLEGHKEPKYLKIDLYAAWTYIRIYKPVFPGIYE